MKKSGFTCRGIPKETTISLALNRLWDASHEVLRGNDGYELSELTYYMAGVIRSEMDPLDQVFVDFMMGATEEKDNRTIDVINTLSGAFEGWSEGCTSDCKLALDTIHRVIVLRSRFHIPHAPFVSTLEERRVWKQREVDHCKTMDDMDKRIVAEEQSREQEKTHGKFLKSWRIA